MQFTLRQPVPADAPALVDMKAKAWRQTYTGTVRQSVIDALDENRERRIDGMTRVIGAEQDAFFMATDEAGRVMGVAACGSGGSRKYDDGLDAHEIRMVRDAGWSARG